jgi:hypothetical protein
MIPAEREQVQSGSGEAFFDCVSIDFCDPGHGVCGSVRVLSMPNAGTAEGLALVFTREELAAVHRVELDRELRGWERAELDGLAMTTAMPLEHWGAVLAAADASLTLELRAISPPIDLSEGRGALVTASAGVELYEQLCEVSGTMSARSKRHDLRCLGRRVHAWGSCDWERLGDYRLLYAAFEARRAITFTSARTKRAGGHGDDLRVAYLVSEDAEPAAFEEVRLSTVFGDDSLPVKAGLELFLPQQELPRRMGGSRICGANVPYGGGMLSLAFLRWSLDGTSAFGSYETMAQR